MVEAAFVMPVFILFVFAIFEFSGVMLSYNGASNAVRGGGRMASVAANDAMADQMIMARVAREAAGIPKGEIMYVSIWHAASPTSTIPSGCKPSVDPVSYNTTTVGVSDGGVDSNGACNVYLLPQANGGAFDMARGVLTQPATYYFGCPANGVPTTGTAQIDCNWPGQNRKVKLDINGVSAVPDYVGVYIKVKHQYYTRMFGSVFTVTDGVIVRIEPQAYTS